MKTIARRLIAGLWFGAGVFVMIAARPENVRVLLTRWHYIALAAPLVLVFFEWRKQRGRIVLLLFAAIVIAALEAMIDVRLAVMPHTGRAFGILHGISMLLLLIDVAAAAAVIAADRET